MGDMKNRSINEGFLENISVPANPFLGIVGTAPENGEYGMMPPGNFGGNMDNRFLHAGSVLYLPVNVHGHWSHLPIRMQPGMMEKFVVRP